MGFRVAAIGRGGDIRNDAFQLGAHLYIDTETKYAVARLTSLGGAAAILSTISDAATVSAFLLGVAKDPLVVSTGAIVGGERAVIGSLTGSPHETKRALDFSVLTGARPQIETMPLERASEAFAKMASGEAKFRMVLTMGH